MMCLTRSITIWMAMYDDVLWCMMTYLARCMTTCTWNVYDDACGFVWYCMWQSVWRHMCSNMCAVVWPRDNACDEVCDDACDNFHGNACDDMYNDVRDDICDSGMKALDKDRALWIIIPFVIASVVLHHQLRERWTDPPKSGRPGKKMTPRRNQSVYQRVPSFKNALPNIAPMMRDKWKDSGTLINKVYPFSSCAKWTLKLRIRLIKCVFLCPLLFRIPY